MNHAYNDAMQVFSSPEWAALGFMVVDPSLKSEALMQLKMQEHPPGSKLVNLLNNSPPATEQIAGQYFTSLASRVSCKSYDSSQRSPRLTLRLQRSLLQSFKHCPGRRLSRFRRIPPRGLCATSPRLSVTSRASRRLKFTRNFSRSWISG